MKTKKYYLILVAVTSILCVPALGEAELARVHKPVLLGWAYPELAGIDQLFVIVEPPDAEPNKDGLVWKELQAKAESKLKEAGIKITYAIVEKEILKRLDVPNIRVDINMLKLDHFQRYVFSIQASLSRAVQLKEQSGLLFKADVWKTEPVMQTVSVQSMPAAVTNAVLNQVETFISCYQIANQKPVQPADANDINAATKRRVRPIVGSTVVEYKYVASKNSKVFHRPECSSAKRIKPKNLVGYNNRDEAIKAGKRPCKICKP